MYFKKEIDRLGDIITLNELYHFKIFIGLLL